LYGRDDAIDHNTLRKSALSAINRKLRISCGGTGSKAGSLQFAKTGWTIVAINTRATRTTAAANYWRNGSHYNMTVARTATVAQVVTKQLKQAHYI